MSDPLYHVGQLVAVSVITEQHKIVIPETVIEEVLPAGHKEEEFQVSGSFRFTHTLLEHCYGVAADRDTLFAERYIRPIEKDEYSDNMTAEESAPHQVEEEVNEI